jgi:hypothetical protein
MDKLLLGNETCSLDERYMNCVWNFSGKNLLESGNLKNEGYRRVTLR